jgi:hypothetical protein
MIQFIRYSTQSQEHEQESVGDIMVTIKVSRALVSLIVLIGLAGVGAGASTGTKRDAARGKELSWVTPPSFNDPDLAVVRHRFPVTDEQGLLLTCIAPEIETNSETDVFKNCTLAPGRTLDDVMHTFIGAIHAEQRRQAEEHAAADKQGNDNSSEKAAQK